MKIGKIRHILRESLRNVGRSRTLTAASLTILAVAGSGAVWYLIFGFTSLGTLLPLRLDQSIRDEYMELALKVDSMQQVSELNSLYADNLLALLMDSVKADSSGTKTDTLTARPPIDSLMAATAAEQLLVERFEASERFNLSVLTPIVAEGMVFFPPVSGVDLRSNSTAPEMPSTALVTGSRTPVSAIYYGTVVDSYFQADKGISLTIQHPNGFISQYSGLTDVFVVKGGKVDSGQRIGLTGDNGALTITMWRNGTPLDAADYI